MNAFRRRVESLIPIPRLDPPASGRLKAELGPKCHRAELRVSTAAKTLPAHQRTAWDNGADTRGAEGYAAVLTETLKRLRRHT